MKWQGFIQQLVYVFSGIEPEHEDAPGEKGEEQAAPDDLDGEVMEDGQDAEPTGNTNTTTTVTTQSSVDGEPVVAAATTGQAAAVDAAPPPAAKTVAVASKWND